MVFKAHLSFSVEKALEGGLVYRQGGESGNNRRTQKMTGVRRTEGQGHAASIDTEEGEPPRVGIRWDMGGLSERKEPGTTPECLA